MKKIITIIILCIITNQLSAQCKNNTNTNPIDDGGNVPSNPRNKSFLDWVNDPLNGFPGAGSFTHNPFFNNFNWYPYNQISIPQNGGFNIGTIPWANNQYTMDNPFNTGLPPNSDYVAAITNMNVANKDFKWEDGWELLWMNLGKTPDGIDIATNQPGSPLTIASATPSNIPYFVLYNRYKGIMRVFANVWFNELGDIGAMYDAVSTKLQFYLPTNQAPGNPIEVNGILRHVSGFDLPLDQFTVQKSIQAPSQGAVLKNKWMLSDFQIGFDPCICNLNKAKLTIEFIAISSLTLQMTSRSISIDQQFLNKDYLEKDFMNLSDVDPNYPKPGARIYKEMGTMLDAYNAAQLKYESNLANYNSLDGLLKRGALDILKQAGGIAGSGLSGSLFTNAPMRNFILKNKTRVGLFSGGLIALDTNNANEFANSVTGATKSLIAQGFDFLSTMINLPGEPSSTPNPLTATFTETEYKGTLKDSVSTKVEELLVPGATPNGYYGSGDPGLSKQSYPAYNEVLGLFALLETPKMEVKRKELIKQIGTKTFLNESEGKPTYTLTNIPLYQSYTNSEFKLKNKLNYRFNHVIDFNFNKTKLYYSFRIKYKEFQTDNSLLIGSTPKYSIIEKNNFIFEFHTKNNLIYEIVNTPFTEVTNMLNEPFEINNIIDYANGPIRSDIDHYSLFNIESIELKLMADMYFIRKGSKEQELNTLQTFTYKLYDYSSNDNQMPSETNSTIGNITFLRQNENLLKHQQGNVIFDNIQLSPSTITSYTHHLVNATEMHIYVENAILKNNISVAPGYTAYIHFLGSAVSNPYTAWLPELVLDNMKSEDLYNYPLIYEATDTEVNTFCSLNNNKYKANASLSKTSNEPIVKPSKVLEKSNSQFNIYPNPANDIATVLHQLNGAMAESICIYNLAGALVQKITLNDNNNNQIILNTLDLAAGVYFVTLNANNNYSETKKLIIAK